MARTNMALEPVVAYISNPEHMIEVSRKRAKRIGNRIFGRIK